MSDEPGFRMTEESCTFASSQPRAESHGIFYNLPLHVQFDSLN